MRNLTERETETLFRKLADYTGSSLQNLLTDEAPSSKSSGASTNVKPDRYVFRLQESRCYYVRESLANLSTNFSRDNLLTLGVCIGKFSKTGKFRIHITALPILSPHARYTITLKPNSEMPFLYGGNVLKAHVSRWSEDCPAHTGIIVLSSQGEPLGFGVTSRSAVEGRRAEGNAAVVFRQGDCGEYLREESGLFG